MPPRLPILFRCPHCSSTQSRLLEARGTFDETARRVRECLTCWRRYTTKEEVEGVILSPRPKQKNTPAP